MSEILTYDPAEKAQSIEKNEKNFEIASELSERIKQTEIAFEEARKIIDGLNDNKNRKRLLELFNFLNIRARKKGWLTRDKNLFQADDIEGCHGLRLNREELKQRFGATFFPVTLVVPFTKWETCYLHDKQEGKDIEYDDDIYTNFDLKKRYEFKWGGKIAEKLGILRAYQPVSDQAGGVFIDGLSRLGQELPYPFNITGIAIYNERALLKERVGYHEDLHRTYQVFSPFRRTADGINSESATDQNYLERGLINELNAYREQAIEDKIPWYVEDDNRPSIFKILSSALYEHVKVDKDELRQACQTMEVLQSKVSESVLTHILINSRNLGELISWKDVELGKSSRNQG